MEKKRILICDDEPDYLEIISQILGEANYSIIHSKTGRECIAKTLQSLPDMLLLDWMLPDIDGIEVCKTLKQNEKTASIPIIMLTVKSKEVDTILGLEMGADDYIIKPFSSGILLSRIKAIFRRLSQPKVEAKIIKSGNIRLNLDQRTCFVKNKPVLLRLKEFDLLILLIKKEEKILTRNFLTEAVWGYEYFGSTRAVDITVTRLRKKLGVEGKNIKTFHNIGYKFSSRQE